jgi:hypothetical protein
MNKAQKHNGMKRGAAMAVAVAALLLAPGVRATHAASAVLGGIDIAGSEKGLALTLSADASFSMTQQQKGPGKNGITSVVSIRCSQVIYGLDEFSFTEFPAGCPVRRIAVSESPGSGTIDLLIGLTITPDKQVQSKQKGNKWIMLLSREPTALFAWSATPSVPTKPHAASQASPDNGQSRLLDVTMLARDRVERFTFQFDRATVMRLKREADRFVVLFVNATSTLAAQRLAPPSSQLSSVELKQVAHGGTMWLGASLYVKDPADAGVVLQAFSDRLVIYCATDSTERLSLWSARTGTAISYDFVKIPQFEVDYRSMEQKAKNDLSAAVGDAASTFAVQENVEPGPKTASPVASPTREAAPAAVQEETGAAQPPGVKKEPEAAGLRAKRLEKLAAEEKAAAIAAEKVALLEERKAQKKKELEEKEAQKQAERAAGEKRAAEQKAQKQAEAERAAKIAMARDSVLRYNAEKQDSVEKAKRYQGPKLVEYHVYGRDPFLPLSRDQDSPVPNVEDLNLVGILYDQVDRIGLFENRQDKTRAYALRENDPIENGYVLRVQPDKVLFLINELGISRTYALKLTKEKQ